MSRSELNAQVDFSGGQINANARRRSDLPALRTGGRVVRNWRATATGQLKQRPGRLALYASVGHRNDNFRVSTGEEFTIFFSAGRIVIYDPTGTIVASNESSAYIWTDNDVGRIAWAQAQDSLFITYPEMRPQIAAWDRTRRTWSFSEFFFDVGANAIRQPYYRQSALGATMSYSGTSGPVTLTCSEAFFTPEMVGLTLSVVGQQVTINAVLSPTQATVTPSYRLPATIKVKVIDVSPFQVGQIVSATDQNIKFEVGYVDVVGRWVHGILLSNMTFQVGQFTAADTLVSPLGSSKFDAFGGVGVANPDAGNTDLPTIQWQEEFMNAVNGWPRSVSYDRGRLIFSDFPQAWNAILWSAIAAPQSFWVDSVAAGSQPAAGAAANSAILDLISGSPRVRYVIGWQQGQFVFTDRGTYFLPISAQSPLVPGSVEFNKIADDGVAPIRPVTVQDAIVFVNAGLTRCAAVRATGSYSRQFVVEDISDAHTELFKSPVQLSIATGDGPVPERYIYVVNADGSLVVGKVSNVGAPQLFVGWAPWDGKGSVRWVSAVGPRVYLTTEYVAPNGALTHIVEIEDTTLYLDFGMKINAATAGMTPPAGKGPFWLMPGSTVTLMDGARDMGERDVDADGFIVPIAGEDLSSPTLVAGYFTPSVFAPFSYSDKATDRTKKLSINRVSVNIAGASDFTLNDRIFPCQRFGDDGDGQPVLLDGLFRVRTLGRSADPTVEIIKHRPGPITLCEMSLEVSN